MANQYTHSGICDASAGIALDDENIIVANDEDNILRVYKANQSGDCLRSYDISKMLVLEKPDQEADIEGAAQLGKLTFWIGSHARNSKGKEKPSRNQFFATKFDGDSISQEGKTYTALLKHLKNHLPEIKEAAEKDVGAEGDGGFNLEGFAACPDGSVILGFRNPVPKDKALLIKIHNPSELIHDSSKAPKFSDAIRLDLGKRGVRAITYWASKNCYLIVGGSYHDDPVVKGEPNFVLYKWDGDPSSKPKSLNVDLGGLNPEAIIIHSNDKVQLLSDNGGHPTDKPCKDLFKKFKEDDAECEECQFRSLVIDIR